MFIAEVHHGWPRSASNQPSQADSNFGNGSGPLFTIYSKIAEKDDDKRVERWQRDAQGILIFVSLLLTSVQPPYQLETLDWPLLYRPRDIGHHVGSGPQATLTG